MAIIQKRFVSEGDKSWVSASVRVGQDLYRAKHPLDKLKVGDHILDCLILPHSGSSEKPRMVIDRFLERELEAGLPHAALIDQLVTRTLVTLRSAHVAGICLSTSHICTLGDTSSAFDIADYLAAIVDDHDRIMVLREIWALPLSPSNYCGRPDIVYARVRNDLFCDALAGDMSAAELIIELGPLLRKLLGALSCCNTLVSYLEPYLLADIKKETMN